MRKFTVYLFIICALFFCSCESDSLAMAGRFYHGNVYASDTEKSAWNQLNRAEIQYQSDRNKLALIYYIYGLLALKDHSNDSAINYFIRANNENNSFLDVCKNIAYLYEERNEIAKAILFYEKSLEIIENDINFCDEEKFPDGHIFNDPHMQYFIKQNLIENSYLRARGDLKYQEIKKNLLLQKKEISGRLADLQPGRESGARFL